MARACLPVFLRACAGVIVAAVVACGKSSPPGPSPVPAGLDGLYTLGIESDCAALPPEVRERTYIAAVAGTTVTLAGATFWKHPTRGLLNAFSIVSTGDSIGLVVGQPAAPDLRGIVEETGEGRSLGIVGTGSGSIRRPSGGQPSIEGSLVAGFGWGQNLLFDAQHVGCAAGTHRATFRFAPGPTTFPAPAVANTMLRLKLDGPASVAPGQRVRFSAIGDMADGATRDVADAVNWQRSASAFELGTSGDVVGRQIGESRLTASFPAPNLLAPLTDSVEVIVGPAGTVRVAAVWKNPPMPAPGRIGFRILPAPPRLDASVIDAFRGLASSNVADAMGRFNFMDPGMQARSGLPLCGLAVTVNARPGDNLMVHKALQLAGPGDIVVVSTNGNTTSAVFGELMCRTAVAREIGGLVVDGAIRDAEGITALGFPAFSRTVTPGGCDKDGPGEINVPVSCGGAVVHPGDIVVGDRDGIAVVPRADAADVLERVRALVGNEDRRVAEIESGQVFKADIDETLRKKGVIE